MSQKFYKSAEEMAAELQSEQFKIDIEQIVATMDYIAMMADIDLEGENNE